MTVFAVIMAKTLAQSLKTRPTLNPFGDISLSTCQGWGFVVSVDSACHLGAYRRQHSTLYDFLQESTDTY
jgi:hypothetical protein